MLMQKKQDYADFIPAIPLYILCDHYMNICYNVIKYLFLFIVDFIHHHVSVGHHSVYFYIG